MKFEDASDIALYLMQTKLSDATLSDLNKCQLEATGDIISGMALDYVGTDVPASFGDYRLNSS